MSISPSEREVIEEICKRHEDNSTRLMDVVIEVQKTYGCVEPDASLIISKRLRIPWVDVRSTVTFYSFLSEEFLGKICIRVCTDMIDKMKGAEDVVSAFEEELGIKVGGTTHDGLFSLRETACIGMCDQAPSALIGDVVANNLTPMIVRRMVKELRKHGDPSKLELTCGEGKNTWREINASVRNNIRVSGEIVFAPFEDGDALKKALELTPGEVIKTVKQSRMRGRGGEGFPTGVKWEFAKKAAGENKYFVCNADEGEPGAFKDRVILTECPDLMFEGVTIGGYATGAKCGVVSFAESMRT